MSFKHTLEGLLNKGKEKVQEYQSTHPNANFPGSSSKPPPPPVNYASKPNFPPQVPSYSRPSDTPSASTPYWVGQFNPSTPIDQIFEQEIGDHGWGNNESQNYTKRPTNSFFTPDHKLVLRAITNTSLPKDKYTSARLISHQKLDRQRGCLTATLTAPCASGIWPAFWLLPSKPFTWPYDGEVDIMETWNADCINHSCLHWGHFNGEDYNKHRRCETHMPSFPGQAHKFDFVWEQPENGQGGRMAWYIDGRSVMRADIPAGTRRMSDWRIILNVAMGGNVCGGVLPQDGQVDFVVHELMMLDAPAGGWEQFGREWPQIKEGQTM